MCWEKRRQTQPHRPRQKWPCETMIHLLLLVPVPKDLKHDPSRPDHRKERRKLWHQGQGSLLWFAQCHCSNDVDRLPFIYCRHLLESNSSRLESFFWLSTSSIAIGRMVTGWTNFLWQQRMFSLWVMSITLSLDRMLLIQQENEQSRYIRCSVYELTYIAIGTTPKIWCLQSHNDPPKICLWIWMTS